MNQKTLMILGAGIGQFPAIKKAKELGITTVAIDKNPQAIGMDIADYAYDTDIIDLEGVLSIALKHKIDGAVTLQSDTPVPIIGRINDKLQLRGISHEIAEWCSNKIKMRGRLKEKKISQPEFEVVKDVSDALEAVNNVGLPCVLKAPDSSGSRGIIKVQSREQVEDSFKKALKYTNGNEILVEAFIEGLEFGAQTFSLNGKCEMVLLHNDQLSSPPYMIPIGHSFPFKYLNRGQREYTISIIKQAVEALRIKEGPTNVDLIFEKKTGKVKILEIGARIGATCLPELIEYHTGIDWIKATILNVLNQSTDLTIRRNQPVAAQIIRSPSDGIYKEFSHQMKLADYEILEFKITAQRGDAVNKFRKGTDRIGKVIAVGNTVKKAEQNIQKFIKGLHIQVD